MYSYVGKYKNILFDLQNVNKIATGITAGVSRERGNKISVPTSSGHLHIRAHCTQRRGAGCLHLFHSMYFVRIRPIVRDFFQMKFCVDGNELEFPFKYFVTSFLGTEKKGLFYNNDEIFFDTSWLINWLQERLSSKEFRI